MSLSTITGVSTTPLSRGVALRQNVRNSRAEGVAQRLLELHGIEAKQFGVRLAVVLHEVMKRHDRSIVAIRTSQLDVAQGSRSEEVLVTSESRHPHATEIVDG